MRLTIITDRNGAVTGTIKGHSNDLIFGTFRPKLILEKGESTHEVEVPDEYEKLNAGELHKKLKEYISRNYLLLIDDDGMQVFSQLGNPRRALLIRVKQPLIGLMNCPRSKMPKYNHT